MDLYKLNAQGQPSVMVENYDSLIWTERFNTVGDFQILAGADPGGMMSLLPEGSILTLAESNIAMVVETHNIIRKKNAAEQIKITGRSFESILDRRQAIQSVATTTGVTDWVVSLRIPSDVAYYIINQICVLGLLDAADIFEPAIVQFPAPADYNNTSGPIKPWSVPRGNLLQAVLGLLQTEVSADATTTPATPAVVQHGIRAVRPTSAATAIGIQIYTGTDKSGTVIFDGTRDTLDDSNYLFSKVGMLNAMYGVAPGQGAQMWKGAAKPTGINRRVGLTDASQSGNADLTVLKNAMGQGLAEAHETAMLDGSLNQDISPYKYGVDYNLGDIVMVQGDYGVNQKSRVIEYIRSEDATGFKSYPTLAAIVT